MHFLQRHVGGFIKEAGALVSLNFIPRVHDLTINFQELWPHANRTGEPDLVIGTTPSLGQFALREKHLLV
jgi:hypothetical protein